MLLILFDHEKLLNLSAFLTVSPCTENKTGTIDYGNFA